MPLTDIAIKNAKPGPKRTRLKDERGLFLEISPSGGKWWRLRYSFQGKENMLSLGVYPDVSLKEARARRDEARRLLAQGQDPSQARKAEKFETSLEAATFELVAREWHAKFRTNWSESHALRIMTRLSQDAFPWIGARPIGEITAPELLGVARRVEARGAIETAHRLVQNCGQVFRYAIATGRAQRDPAADLRGAIPPSPTKHHPSITEPKAVCALLRAIDGYEGSLVVRCALRLAYLSFVRPGELRRAEWAEFDFEAAQWRIPAAKMKMREQHIVPLSRQALEALQELRPLTGDGRFVFPSERTKERPMSENTVNAALRRMGYGKGEMTGHGFRSMASTLLNEQGWNRDAIERQLAHAERDEIRAAYNYAEFLPERRKMMQSWADYLDSLKDGASIIPFQRTA
ncbi:tyrosine-type recombinase/integrase [Desulfarculus baarsii]